MLAIICSYPTPYEYSLTTLKTLGVDGANQHVDKALIALMGQATVTADNILGYSPRAFLCTITPRMTV
jgi:hypothetical protein